MSKPINVYSLAEVRDALNENVVPVMNRLEFIQDHTLGDAKLAIGYSIAIIAASSYLLDKKLEYKEALGYQKLLILLYFVLSGLFWYFNKYIQKDAVYVGKSKTDDDIVVYTKFEKGEPVFKMRFIWNGKKEFEAKLPINTVFNESGYLQTELLKDFMSEQIDILKGKKDS